MGFGAQVTERFGFEMILDTAPAFDNETLLVDTLEDEFVRIYSYHVEIWGDVYISFVGTLTIPVEDKISLVLKDEASSYQVEADKFEFETFRWNYDLDLYESGTAAVNSAGLLFHTVEKRELELSVNKVFGDQGVLSFNGTFRYNF